MSRRRRKKGGSDMRLSDRACRHLDSGFDIPYDANDPAVVSGRHVPHGKGRWPEPRAEWIDPVASDGKVDLGDTLQALSIAFDLAVAKYRPMVETHPSDASDGNPSLTPADAFFRCAGLLNAARIVKWFQENEEPLKRFARERKAA